MTYIKESQISNKLRTETGVIVSQDISRRQVVNNSLPIKMVRKNGPSIGLLSIREPVVIKDSNLMQKTRMTQIFLMTMTLSKTCSSDASLESTVAVDLPKEAIAII